MLAKNDQVIVAVDDAHWVDRFSLEALAFTARRLGADGIAMLFTIGEAELPNSGLEGFPVMQVTGLDRKSARTLVLRQQLAAPLGPVMVNRLLDGSGGNPLALVELLTLLNGQPLRNFASSTEPLPVGDQLNRAFSLTIAQLPERTQDAVLLLAVMDAAPVDTVVAALRQGGLSIDALEPAEAAGLIVEPARRSRASTVGCCDRTRPVAW